MLQGLELCCKVYVACATWYQVDDSAFNMWVSVNIWILVCDCAAIKDINAEQMDHIWRQNFHSMQIVILVILEAMDPLHNWDVIQAYKKFTLKIQND